MYGEHETFEVLGFGELEPDRMIGRLREPLKNLHVASGIERGPGATFC